MKNRNSMNLQLSMIILLGYNLDSFVLGGGALGHPKVYINLVSCHLYNYLKLLVQFCGCLKMHCQQVQDNTLNYAVIL